MSADLRFDNKTWEIKYINNSNIKTIRGYIEHTRKKKADNGIFYWDSTDKIDFLKAARVVIAQPFESLSRNEGFIPLYPSERFRIRT